MDKKMLSVGLMLLILIGAVATGMFFFFRPASFHGTSYAEPYPTAPEIQLTRADGSTFRLSETRGKAVALFFGYTTCPDVCPITMAELKQVRDKLGTEADQLQVLFVTVDPQRDTPQRVQDYVDHFNASFIGLSGSEAELAKVWNDYGIFREKVESTSAAGYLVNYTARITLIDPQGNLRVSFQYDTPSNDIVHDLKLLLP
jgi:protein SCO1/2